MSSPAVLYTGRVGSGAKEYAVWFALEMTGTPLKHPEGKGTRQASSASAGLRKSDQ